MVVFWLKQAEAQQHDFLYSHLVNFPRSIVNPLFTWIRERMSTLFLWKNLRIAY